jgi:Ankyrin repeats (3 copies)
MRDGIKENQNDGVDEDDWCHFADAVNAQYSEEDEDSNEDGIAHGFLVNNGNDDGDAGSAFLLEDIPAQLHPAVSFGMRHVSSCYFSIQSQNSNNSYNSLLDLLQQQKQHQSSTWTSSRDGIDSAENFSEEERRKINLTKENTSPRYDHSIDTDDILLYHEFLMEVCTYLSATELAAFSQTCRRANFEVFYYLSLQLQQSLLVSTVQQTNTHACKNIIVSLQSQDQQTGRTSDQISRGGLYPIGSCSVISRLAKLDPSTAKEIVDEYLASNSTLRTLPLSYSLAYIRHYLAQKGFSGGLNQVLQAMHGNSTKTDRDEGISKSEKDSCANTFSQQTLARAALFVTLVGAVGGAVAAGGVDVESLSIGTDMALQSVLVRVGFLGSLMMGGAATATVATRQKIAENEPDGEGDAESDHAIGHTQKATSTTRDFAIPSLFEMRKILQAAAFTIAQEEDRNRPMVLFNPYDHLESNDEAPLNRVEGEETWNETNAGDQSSMGKPDATSATFTYADSTNPKTYDRKMPSGCVGAYSRAIKRASESVRKCIKARRKAQFEALSPDDQRRISLEFLTACSSNDSLHRVKDIVAQGIDTNAFYVGSDGQLSCALHSAAFNGADKVVDFLCTGVSVEMVVDLETSPDDGGLVDVDLRDGNGWTALHFAAGANSVPVIKVLAKHGAKQQVQASNGYTPFLWAKRLSNREAAEELANVNVGSNSASIASRFLALLPTNC